MKTQNVPKEINGLQRSVSYSRDIQKPELRHFGGYEWPEGDGATLCKHWKVIRGGSYYKIGNLRLASVSPTKLGAGG